MSEITPEFIMSLCEKPWRRDKEYNRRLAMILFASRQGPKSYIAKGLGYSSNFDGLMGDAFFKKRVNQFNKIYYQRHRHKQIENFRRWELKKTLCKIFPTLTPESRDIYLKLTMNDETS